MYRKVCAASRRSFLNGFSSIKTRVSVAFELLSAERFKLVFACSQTHLSDNKQSFRSECEFDRSNGARINLDCLDCNRNKLKLKVPDQIVQRLALIDGGRIHHYFEIAVRALSVNDGQGGFF